MLTLLRQVSHELGITLVLVTHDLNVAEQAERIIQLEDGHIARDTGAHHDLEHRHRAGQRVVHQIGSESLQTAEGTVSLDIDGFFAEVGPEQRWI